MNKTNSKVDGLLRKNKKWRKEFEALRSIALDCHLTEEVKWRLPCYSFEKSNIVILQGFKEICALMFFKGALLKDPKGILKKVGEHTQAARRVEFTDVREIVDMKSILSAYIKQAIEVEKAGLKVKLRKTSDIGIPEEFQSKLDESAALKTAFEALTPGRQRAYLFYFSSAKQSKTRESRVEKCTKRILNGKGLDD